MYKSKIDLEMILREDTQIILDVGCGSRKFDVDAIGIDVVDGPEVDIVGDIFEILRDLPEGCIDAVQAHHFIEHIDDITEFLHEIGRVLRPKGSLTLTVPHFSSPYFYSDPTHLRFFGLYTMSYFVGGYRFKRSVPCYAKSKNINLHLEHVALNFKAPREFPVSYMTKKFLGSFANLNRATREFYERWLTGLVSCYEIKYVLRSNQPPGRFTTQ